MSDEPAPGDDTLEQLVAQWYQGGRREETWWPARALATALGYPRYRAFGPALARARRAAAVAGLSVAQHFHPVSPGGRHRDWELSPEACRLVVQNADPHHAEVARAQTYIAVQVRRAERARARAADPAEVFLASLIGERVRREGVDDPGQAARLAEEMRARFAATWPGTLPPAGPGSPGRLAAGELPGRESAATNRAED